MNKILLLSRLALMAGLTVIVAAGSAVAHGTEQHPETTKMDQHMQAMMAVKEKVPAEYRIMERTPVIPDAQSLARGKELFNQNCSVCHGEKGDGKGPAAAALATPPASFLDTHHSRMYNPGEKYWIITDGSATTGMPAFPDLSSADRWHLVNYILSLQQEENLEELFIPEN
jgi:mono/diheme cytochrome c family protein